MNTQIQYEGSSSQPKMAVVKAAELLGISVQAVHKKLKEKNISCPKIGNKAYITHSIARRCFLTL